MRYDYQENCSKLFKENADLKAKLEARDKGLDQFIDVVADLNAKLEAAEKERDNLQAQLKGITEARDTFYNDMVLYKKSCDDLIKLRDELFDKVDALTAERDNLQAQVNSLKTTLEHCDLARDKWLNKYVDLQAANAVLRGALEYYKTHEDGGVRAVQALSTTPDEAGERVKNLVCALAECLAFIDQLKEHGITEWTGEQAAKDALAKYRGGAD